MIITADAYYVFKEATDSFRHKICYSTQIFMPNFIINFSSDFELKTQFEILKYKPKKLYQIYTLCTYK